MKGLFVGDKVFINKDDQGMNWIPNAEVIKIPAGEGDVWGFLNLDTGQEIYTLEKWTAYKSPALPQEGE